MARRDIILFPHPGLKEVCREIPEPTAATHRLLKDLSDTLDRSPGVGLAAPQIGVPLRAVVVDVNRAARPGKAPPLNHGRLTLLNPRVAKAEGELVFREGCLSVPDFLADIRRAARVRVEAWSAEGTPVAIETEGFEAVALQHEIDHLDGVLFLDRVANLKTDLFRRKQRPT
jgi:peptide deformylase